MLYAPEEFSAGEADILRRYVTNLDQPVFALVNLPETVKGALFARYSRSAKSLRRLFLDEFLGDLAGQRPPEGGRYAIGKDSDRSVRLQPDEGVGAERAAKLYARVLNEYGDDS